MMPIDMPPMPLGPPPMDNGGPPLPPGLSMEALALVGKGIKGELGFKGGKMPDAGNFFNRGGKGDWGGFKGAEKGFRGDGGFEKGQKGFKGDKGDKGFKGGGFKGGDKGGDKGGFKGLEEGLVDNPPSRTLWLGGLSAAHTEDSLWTYFQRFGPLDCIKVLYSKGIAFVNFMGIPGAVAAKNAAMEEMICGSKVQPGFAKHTAPPPVPTGKFSLGEHESPSSIVWIGGLQMPPLNEKFMNDLFADCPGLVNVVVYEDKKIAFVNFTGIPYATAVRNSLIGKPLAGIPIKVLYGKPPGAGAPANRLIGYPDSPAQYPLPSIPQPVDYYGGVDQPDALSEEEVEELLDHMRALKTYDVQKMKAAVHWVLERDHLIKDTLRVFELRLMDYYLQDVGKRLQACYFYFMLLIACHEDKEYEDVFRLITKGGFTGRLCQIFCWMQPTQAAQYIADVFSRAVEVKAITEEEFLGINAFIKSEAEISQLKAAYRLADKAEKRAAKPDRAVAVKDKSSSSSDSSSSESSSEIRRRRKKRRK
ncbi:Flowering time control protein FPA [Diplonema papillatum]|nr:Flowering time control protein FPA [Diplonema papillatum]